MHILTVPLLHSASTSQSGATEQGSQSLNGSEMLAWGMKGVVYSNRGQGESNTVALKESDKQIGTTLETRRKGSAASVGRISNLAGMQTSSRMSRIRVAGPMDSHGEMAKIWKLCRPKRGRRRKSSHKTAH